MDKFTNFAMRRGVLAAWGTALIYGIATGLADFFRAALFREVNLWSACLVGFRSTGLISLLVGMFAVAVLCLLWLLNRTKLCLVSQRFEAATVIGSGVFAIAFVLFFERSLNGYEALVKAALIVGVGFLAGAALPSKALPSSQSADRLFAVLPKFCVVGTLAILPLFGFSIGASWHPMSTPAAVLPKKAAGPNIVLVIIDSGRADRFSLYGYRKKTSPFLEDLAAESTVFNNAIAAAPWTLPSHASIFTGLYPGQHNTHAEHFWLDNGYRTMAEILADNGYQTVMFSNNDYVSQSTNLVQGFERCWYKGHWTDDARYYGQSMGGAVDSFLQSFWSEWNDRILAKMVKNPADALDYPSAAVTNKAIEEWLTRGRDAKRPFFLCVNYMDVHFPYNPSDEIARLFLDEATLKRSYALRLRRPPVEYFLDVSKGRYSAEELRIIGALYDADVRSLDAELEKLCAKLRALGLFDRTALIITSDHGEYLGTHNRMAHGLGLHEEVLRIPLLARYPGVFAPGKRITSVVTTPDLFDTVLALAKVTERPAGMAPTQKLFSMSEDDSRYAFSEFRFPLHVLVTATLRDDNSALCTEGKAIRDRTHKLIWKARGDPEFFDLVNDPFELKSLYSKENEKIQAMQQELFKWMSSDVPQQKARHEEKDHATRENQRLIEQMRTLGYVK
jgi:arylsulfatase A-like enzyme